MYVRALRTASLKDAAKIRLLSAPLLTLALACSSTGVRVRVMRPAEIDLSGRSILAMERVSGPSAAEYQAEIRSAISASDYLTLVEPLDPSTAQVELRATVIEHGYRETLERQTSTCTHRNGSKVTKYKCTNYNRKGRVMARLGVDLIDLGTSEVVTSKSFGCSKRRSTWSRRGTPSSIDSATLKRRCVVQLVRKLIRTISPWKDTLILPFEESKELPRLKKGILWARADRWDKALAEFEKAAAEAEAQSSPEAKAKAHLDLGLALAVVHRFEAGLRELEIARSLHTHARYKRALTKVREMKRDFDRVAEPSSLGQADPSP